MIRLRRRFATAPDSGLSMMELIVSMAVTTLVLAIMGNMLVTVARITADSNKTTSRSGVASNIMNEIVKVIRPATNIAVSTSSTNDPAIVAATPTSLTLYSFVDADPASPAPKKVTFRVDAQGMVFEDRWTATVSQGYWVFTGAVSTSQIGGPIQGSLFTYLDGLDAPVVPSGTGLTLAQRSTVASIAVSVQIGNTAAYGSDPVIITNNTVAMPNLGLNETAN